MDLNTLIETENVAAPTKKTRQATKDKDKTTRRNTKGGTKKSDVYVEV